MRQTIRFFGVIAVLALASCGGTAPVVEPVLDEGVTQAPAPADADNPGDGDEVIQPQYPDGVPSPEWEGPEDEGPTTPGKDLVVGGELVGSGTGSGAVVSLEGTDDVHQTHLKMVHVHWRIAGDVEEAYLHASLNRWVTDGAKEDPCGKIGGRFLAVNNDANNFNEGSPDAEVAASYLTGQVCHDNADCAGLSTGANPAANVGLKADVTSQNPQRTPMPAAPVCRIDLKGLLDKGVAEGEFDTLSYGRTLRMVLVAKTKSGAIVRDERTWTAPRPFFSSLKVFVAEGRFRVAADYAFAVGRPRLQDCRDEHVEMDDHDLQGQGKFQASCAVSPGVSDIGLSLSGVGYGNFVARAYRVQVSGGELTLKDAGNASCDQALLPFSDCSGSLNLAAQMEPSDYAIKNLKTGNVIDSGTVTLGGKVVLSRRRPIEGGWEPVMEMKIPVGDTQVIFSDVRRDHDHSVWEARLAADADVRDVYEGKAYAMDFDVEILGGSLPPDFGGSCEKALAQIHVRWNGRHVREIGTDEPELSLSSSSQPDGDVYDHQGGEITVTADQPGRYHFWVIDAQGRKHENRFSADLECGN